MIDLIRVYKNILPATICNEIIKKFDADPRRGQGVTGSPDFGGGIRPDIKTSNDLPISALAMQDASWKKYVDILAEGYMRALKLYADDVRSVKYLVGQMGVTGFQIQCYSPNEGHYAEHVDANSKMASLRQLSGLIYLNSVQEGGETLFPYQEKKVKPVQGSMAIFPSNYAYPHEAIMPVSESKYIVVTWLGFA